MRHGWPESRSAVVILLSLLLQHPRALAFVSSTVRLPQLPTVYQKPQGSCGAIAKITAGHRHPDGVSRVLMMAKGKKKAERIELIESVAAATKGRKSNNMDDDDQAQEEDSEDESATPVFNVDRLKAETKTPFRTFRIFIYGGFGFSALIGGVTSLTQLAATVSEQEGSLELSKVLVNLLVDFGVMAVAVFAYNFETSQQAGLEEAEAAAREKKKRLKATKITSDVNTERVQEMRRLSVKVPGSDAQDGSGPREAPVGVLMDEARQGFCVLAGSREFLRDSMINAMLSKNQIFPSLNLLVVPVEMSAGGGADGSGGKGFAKPMNYDEEGYVAVPVNEGEWKDLMALEFEAATRQGATKAAVVGEDGIVLVVSKEGKVLRRGVGVPTWKMIRDDVDPPKKKK